MGRISVPINDLAQDEALSLALLGGFSMNLSGDEIRIAIQKGKALLAYLVLSPTQNESRERVAGLLWSESEEFHARASLRQTLRQLRQAFDEAGIDVLEADRSGIRVDLSKVDLDVHRVLDAAGRGETTPLMFRTRRLTDALLSGFEDVDPAFRTWLLVQRQTLFDQLTVLLEAVLSSDVHDLVARKNAAAALAQIDPSHEGACRYLMQAYAGEGDVSSALRQYKALWDLLDDEYGMEPSDATQDLVARIKSGEFEASNRTSPLNIVAAPVPAVSIPSGDVADTVKRRLVLTVGEFSADGIEPERAYLIRGFRHELIGSLVRFRDWVVLDQASTGGNSDPGDGEIVYNIEATLLPGSDGVTLVLTLKDANSGHYVWSARHNINLEEWFAAQQSIVRRIAVALNLNISAERLSRVSGKPDITLDVYDRWLRGQALILRWRPEDETRAEAIFRSIIEEAPGFASGYSSLVQIMNSRHHIFPGEFRTREREKEALALAKQSVQLDPLDSKTHLCLAWAQSMNSQFERAELSFTMAYELNENDPWTMLSAAHGLAFCDRLDSARELADQALELGIKSSTLHWGYQVGIRFLLGDYEGAIAAADRAEDVIYNLPAWRAAAHYHLGRTDESRAEARRFCELIRTVWHGSMTPDDQTIFRWLLHSFPIRRKDAWERLRDGLLGTNAYGELAGDS